METDELTETLEAAGLSPYQAEAYVTLLELGSVSARELADASGVPGPRIYDVVRDLEADGYVTTFEQDRLYVRANDPSEALAGLRDRISRFETAVDEVEARYQTPTERENEVTIVRQFKTVFESAKTDICEAQRHVQAAVTLDQFRDLRPDLRDAYERGVYVQLSLYVSDEEDAAFEPEEFEGVCTEVRLRELPDVYLVLTDRRTVAYAPHLRTPREYGVLVDDRVTAHVFHWFFLTSLWEVYDPIYDDHNEDPPLTFVEITECVRTVDRLLRDDATVHATVDGYSVRTGRNVTFEGTIVSVDYTGHTMGDDPPELSELAARATLVLETDDGTYTIGGEGAVVEDISADRITITNVE
jgi:sugar-specific transcriptional regulator TrmB